MADDDEDEGSLGEEFREVDPMQVIEDRLMLLEAWLHEDPHQEDVNQKRDEYLSLLEELEILGKKMRKTDKLLAVPNQPNIAKLERKRDQYEREVTDIVLYAEQDAFFDLEGENGEAALNAYMKANSLLGKPLETLAEMSGFEDSKAWNDSFGPLDMKSVASDSSSRRTQRDQQHLGQSIASLDMSKPHNVTVLKKKLKKAKQMLEDSTSESERKKLLKKIKEYQQVLQDAMVKQDDDEESTEAEEGSEGSIEPPMKSPTKVLPTMRKKEGEDYILLKKKLTKATKLLQTAKSSKDLQKFQKKVDEYVAALSKYDAWKQDQLAYGIFDGKAGVDEHFEEAEWMEQQAERDEERLAQEERLAEKTQQRRTQAKSMLDSAGKTKVPSKASKETAAAIPKSSASRRGSHRESDEDASMDLERYIEEERKQQKVLRKKLKKVEEMIDAKLEKEGQDARYTKEFRKLQKKRKQYLTELGEDHESLANISMSGSMDMSFNMSSSIHNNAYDGNSSVDISLGDLGYNGGNTQEDEDEDEREYRLQQEEMALERQKRRQERLAAARTETNNKKVDEDDPDVQLIRKKLKKLDKMLKEHKVGSKDHDKLLRKRKQYLAELGEEGD